MKTLMIAREFPNSLFIRITYLDGDKATIMSEPLTPKVALFSALYAILIFLFASLLYFGMMWFANDVLFELLNWFNSKTTFWKIVYFILGGGIVISLSIALFQILGGFLSAYIFGRLPLNWFTGIFCAVIYL